MNTFRAKEIAASPVMANVTYDGKQCYIQHVNETDETARIYPLDQPENEFDVAVSSLIEH
ncbi:small acid-soluble spore protein H [Paenibacillus contaminans]|jgi:small acid-soluble spore protein H (minor)|uniref:Small acid-soluble spore protein H n=1 Tax=Paenibacillus contaminans TaxID=450362 RepID=A0A329MKZ9_9BACL|nr:small acid-soluble spore protein H [Paenibacillus contaminans]RAV20464.1 small acid-soluble spore protein H [Paenibacillus contaminans]